MISWQASISGGNDMSNHVCCTPNIVHHHSYMSGLETLDRPRISLFSPAPLADFS